MKQLYAMTLISFPLLAFVHAQAANLVDNGDFEQGNIGFDTDYSFAGGHNKGEYAIVTDPTLVNAEHVSTGDHTTGAGLMMYVDSFNGVDMTVWSKQVAVRADQTYELSAWILNSSTGPVNQTWDPECRCYPVDRKLPVAERAMLEFYANNELIGQFSSDKIARCERFSGTWNSGLSTSATITIINRNLEPAGNDFALDDISLEGIDPSRTAYDYLDAATLDDTNGNGYPEIAVLRVSPNGVPEVMIKDEGTKKNILTFRVFNAKWMPKAITTKNVINPEITVLAVNDESGEAAMQVFDASTGQLRKRIGLRYNP